MLYALSLISFNILLVCAAVTLRFLYCGITKALSYSGLSYSKVTIGINISRHRNSICIKSLFCQQSNTFTFTLVSCSFKNTF